MRPSVDETVDETLKGLSLLSWGAEISIFLDIPGHSRTFLDIPGHFRTLLRFSNWETQGSLGSWSDERQGASVINAIALARQAGSFDFPGRAGIGAG